MAEIKSLDELLALLKKWSTERPERAKFPRIAENPYGDNTVGMAYDEGWWACFQNAKDHGWFGG